MPNRVLILYSLIFLLSCSKEENGSNKREPQLFEQLSVQQTQVDFSNNLKETLRNNILSYEYFYNGGGVAVGDINNDGLPDLFFTGNQVQDRLYLNRGNLEFEDITESAGLNERLDTWSTGVTMVDINNDGFLDIYVSKSGKLRPTSRENKLYINQGDLTFIEEAKEYGLNDRGFSTQALFFDYDLDNDLDMFLINHNVMIFYNDDGVALQDKLDPFVGDKLYRNDNGSFVEVGQESGIKQNPLGYGLGVAVGDINKDGFPDIYVTNDYDEPDYLYLNNGNGTFTDVIKQQTKHISNFGMGVDIADINNDQLPDIFVADMTPADNYRQKTTMRPMSPDKFYKMVEFGFHHQYMYNSLQLNNGDNSFSEIAQFANVSQTDWSWATLLMDFNNDGNRDLFVSNGYRKEISNKDYLNNRKKIIDSAKGTSRQNREQVLKKLIDEIPSAYLPNFIFENKGDLTFADRSKEWGVAVPTYSNGATAADLDNDGDLDLIMNNIDTTAFIFKNNLDKNNYLKVDLDGPSGNKSGFGAKIALKLAQQTLYYEHFLTKGYQSSIEDIIHFGLGEASTIDVLTIRWPDGKMQHLENVKANQQLEIAYSAASILQVEPQKDDEPLLTDITSLSGINYEHRENDFNDFEKEILLPHKVSQIGPATAIGDVNGDGLEDIYLGSAAGYSATLYLQNADQRFFEKNMSVFEKDKLHEDVDAAFFDYDLDGDLDLYIVSGGNEFEPGSMELTDRVYTNDGKGNFKRELTVLPKLKESGSVVRPYDFDSDGDLDLFIGGRLVPGMWPSPASSRLLKNESGVFVDVTSEMAPELIDLGLVTDAIWTNLDKDNVELVIAGEWMPVTIFRKVNDKFENITADCGLNNEVGWWYSLSTADVNSDGVRDLVAGNLGLNYKYKASQEEPFQIYYDDFDNTGSGDIVLGYFNDGELFPLRGRQCSSDQMPFIKEKFETYHDFGSASLVDVYGSEALSNALHYKATNFASSVILNTGDSLKVENLPTFSQLSSVNDILVYDFNQDGQDDLLLAGNMHDVEVETIRNDASYGVLLLNHGGDFEYIPNREISLFLNGEVRSLELIQLGAAGQGILVGFNEGPVKLFKINTGTKSLKI
ncbi:MAG: CRTAC1 family protein [Bacteroidota bacterium]